MLRTNCQKLYDFLNKWYKLFKDEKSTVSELLDKSFEEKCEEFGFYEDYNRLIDDSLLSIEDINEYIENCEYDLYDAASILYGIWYFYRYVDLDKNGIKDSKTRKWFIKVLKWMLMHTGYALNMDYGSLISCKIKTTIFETGRRKNDGIEEVLIIKNDGNIKHSLKKAGCKADNNLTADREKINDFINRLSKCFVYGEDFFLESRYGSVEIEFTNSENIKNRFFCGLRKLVDEEGNDLSMMLRQLCGLYELLGFDGKLKLIDELVLEYSYDNIKEKLIVKREESSLTYIQDIDGRRISISIDDKDIKHLFNDINLDCFFSSNSDSLRKYTGKLVLSNGQELSFSGSYDADSLSNEFVSFIENAGIIIDHYAKGDIFKRSIYSNAKQTKGDYMLCKVVIKRSGKKSYYLSIEDDICIGDDVIVPGLGHDDEQYIANVKEISFCKEKKLPCPLESMKYIERHCTNEDYVFMDEMFY